MQIALTLANGEKVEGTSNYTDTEGVEIRTADNEFRWFKRNEIQKIQKIQKEKA